MSEVLLAALGPDSTVYPVACNDKGELLLEEPIVSEGPQGPPGPEGPQGENGADGTPGERGPEGPAGPKGEDGQDGQNGTDGAPGGQGPQGEPGQNGQNGADGAPGERGPEGPQGPQGDQGPQGPEGPAGPQGQPMASVIKSVVSGVSMYVTTTQRIEITIPTGIPEKRFINFRGQTIGGGNTAPASAGLDSYIWMSNPTTVVIERGTFNGNPSYVSWEVIEYN